MEPTTSQLPLPTPTTEPDRPPARWVCVALLAMAALIALMRLRTYHQPLDWDLATYAVMAHESHAGRMLYADLWDMKPPGIFASFWLAEGLVGYGYPSVYLLSVTAAVATLLGVYAAGAAWGRAAGLFAALCWTIISGDLALEANRPNTEVFVNALLAWSFALLVRWPARHTRSAAEAQPPGRTGHGDLWRAAAIGLLLAIGSVYRQVVIPLGALLAFAHWLQLPPGCTRRRALAHIALIAGLTLAVWAAVLGYFAATGRLTLFWNTVFVYTRFYGGDLTGNLLSALAPTRFWPPLLYGLLPLAALSLIALFARPRRSLRHMALLLALLVGVQIAIAMPGHFHRHYYQHWMIPLTIAAGWGMATIARALATPTRRPALSRALGATVVLFLLWQQIPSYLLPAREWSRRQAGEWFAVAQQAGPRIDALLDPGETFYAWADEPYLYFLTRRPPPAVGLWKMHTLHGPMAPWLTARTLTDLQCHPPELILLWTPVPGPTDHPIYQWCITHYRPLPGNQARWPFTFMVRRGGRLDASPSTIPSTSPGSTPP